jgi:hypothetical protein
VFDLQTGGLVDEIRVSLDTVNGCMFHPYLNLLSVATGKDMFQDKRPANKDDFLIILATTGISY